MLTMIGLFPPNKIIETFSKAEQREDIKDARAKIRPWKKNFL